MKIRIMMLLMLLMFVGGAAMAYNDQQGYGGDTPTGAPLGRPGPCGNGSLNC